MSNKIKYINYPYSICIADLQSYKGLSVTPRAASPRTFQTLRTVMYMRGSSLLLF